jgi:hypothetical protein
MQLRISLYGTILTVPLSRFLVSSLILDLSRLVRQMRLAFSHEALAKARLP